MVKILVGLLGDKRNTYLPHESAEKALMQIASALEGVTIRYEWLPTKTATTEQLSACDCIWAGSGPYLDEENALLVIKYARENKIPTIGTCSGFKYMVVEYAKHVFKADDPYKYIGLNSNCTKDYKDLAITLKPGCSLIAVFSSDCISETSHCNFEIDDNVVSKAAIAFEFCGVAEDGRTVLIRLPKHPFFVASLFLPQLKEDSKLVQAWLQPTIALKQNRELIG